MSEGSAANSPTTFSSNKAGSSADNPSDPLTLTDAQLDTTVALYFYDRAEVNVTLSVASGQYGRTFAISDETPFDTNGCDPLAGLMASPPPPAAASRY